MVGIWNASSYVVSSGHTSLVSNWRIDRFSRFCTTHGCVQLCALCNVGSNIGHMHVMWLENVRLRTLDMEIIIDVHQAFQAETKAETKAQPMRLRPQPWK